MPIEPAIVSVEGHVVRYDRQVPVTDLKTQTQHEAMFPFLKKFEPSFVLSTGKPVELLYNSFVITPRYRRPRKST